MQTSKTGGQTYSLVWPYKISEYSLSEHTWVDGKQQILEKK